MTDLTTLVAPRSVAVIGASGTAGSPGHSATVNLLRHSRISDAVYLVNPNREQIEGHPCLSSVEDLPEDQVDVAIVIVAAEAVVPTVEACARRGVRNAIIPTGGLGETGAAGRAAEQQLRVISEKYGIRLYGPNCPGLTNVHDGIYLSVSPSGGADTTPGGIGLITQGGALGRTVMQYGDHHVGIGCWLSAGNEVDLELSDFVEHLAKDGRITTIACVIEGFTNGPRFLRAVRAANAAGKPVTALVLGRSESGAKAAQSHTAHMATGDRVTRSLLRQHGVTVVEDIDELVEQAAFFDRGQLPETISTCVISFSGGAAVAAADALETHGLAPSAYTHETRDRIAEAIPEFGIVGNPLDLTMEAMQRPDIVRDAVAALREDAGINTLVVAVPADYADITARFVTETLRFEGPQKQVVAVWSSPRRGSGWVALEEHGLLPFNSTTAMARTLARAGAYKRWLDRHETPSDKTSAGAWEPYPQESGNHSTSGTAVLTEYRSKQLLAQYGIEVPAGSLCTDREGVAAVVEAHTGPSALKAQASLLTHKTEAGGVALGVVTAEGARVAWDDMLASLQRAGVAPATIDGVLVEQMAPAGLDLIVSVRHDPVFGRIHAIGLGGLFTEILGDIIFLTPDAGPGDLGAGLETLASHPVLAGARGGDPIQVDRLAGVLNVLDRVVVQEELDEIEINPLRWIGSTAGSLIALDAIATVRE